MLQQNLTQEQAIDNLVEVVSSDYFSGYKLKIYNEHRPFGSYSDNRINVGPFCLKIDHGTMRETGKVITDFLEATRANNYELGQVVLEMIPPGDALGDEREKVQSPLVSISINERDESRGIYDFSVYARLTDNSELKSVWAEGVYNTLMNLLPYKLEQLTSV